MSHSNTAYILGKSMRDALSWVESGAEPSIACAALDKTLRDLRLDEQSIADPNWNEYNLHSPSALLLAASARSALSWIRRDGGEPSVAYANMRKVLTEVGLDEQSIAAAR